MKSIKTCSVVIVLAIAFILFGCRQPQQIAPAPEQPKPQTENAPEKPCSGQSSPSPEQWQYNYHAQWELPGAAVPEIFAAAKAILIDEWKMPTQYDSRNESRYVDFLTASLQVKSALNTTFDLTIVKLNENTLRLAIDAKSKQIPPAQLEEHCSLMYDNIINYLNSPALERNQPKKVWIIRGNNSYYVIQDYEFKYPVKAVFDAAIAVQEEIHTNRSLASYDDFASRISFKTSNECELAMDIKMTDENKCRLTFLSQAQPDTVIAKWSDIFIQRLRQKLTKPSVKEQSSSDQQPKLTQNKFYGRGNSPSSVSKTVEYPATVIKTTDTLQTVLKQLQISSDQTRRDALTAGQNFKTANGADWWVAINQMEPNRSKLVLSASNIYDEDFQKYASAILGNLEKLLQQPESAPLVESAAQPKPN